MKINESGALMGIAQASRVLGIDRRLVDQLVKQGQVKSVVIGARTYIVRSSIMAFLGEGGE
ncbi:helix-turn-helix domain-containing protein [Mycolicibacterium smegmatis]|uniref:helix-turn-helix domain-containing protein n=1 Tax=Mycolicibacterium smegmatis TaxID=1772 RepID=UPI0005D8B17A|nr:helix-turn-helix domain-containing protein [Mycolicibacterium smegmatis]MDF1899063.1 helix-turn-helix domain-containing protein [Mycolicibacterium smegmatis]MDF1904887.1 helix-turn-helix domain-containing protein [Mycolicibacterium smegmatis]MDF1918756.1 helix-turn-helix domain-containing protein [Mycolicibacterium smegmatis]MDF1924051.1 helix-turn-helix domain-containing protein [Mycolicibacterium smegmatis]UAK53337.1 helix-turn-helix domain-containing protein [Mycolicibacterium smegmatis]